MASALWTLRGELHEFETLLEGIRDNYSLVTLQIRTAIALRPTRTVTGSVISFLFFLSFAIFTCPIILCVLGGKWCVNKYGRESRKLRLMEISYLFRCLKLGKVDLQQIASQMNCSSAFWGKKALVSTACKEVNISTCACRHCVETNRLEKSISYDETKDKETVTAECSSCFGGSFGTGKN